ncbi:hypothetical protein A3A95_01500 [Candidatus Nomurabacteria bacterium RIFCSPLOWO2_01_FULL_39_18]|uniref:Uncharacterized protein n=1 Tax=Candidatus Nomurabacteria bacterium RIFCSPHIGHO2_01_FULL_40_24b TaxID=1801739 RepID=A0A1F6V8D8_9BACT|nr:MAG: hypothetical protein A2647_00190 [Candidatus Nomurabacteria bacterium RIFCSPHIGHO2_01_FULL_40_24b]OGI88964.1 MAG: hypothetical protein A3A95_01500 [Candidatus Nomurabacteria bacterium RIFCSPLOWO2_01_FULL_39_18]
MDPKMELGPGGVEKKERIMQAAIRVSNGKVFIGKGHKIILEEIYEEDPGLVDYREEGFVTNKRPFITRQEAAEVAFNAGQTKTRKRKLMSQDLRLE